MHQTPTTSLWVCFWRYIVHYNDPSLSFGLFPVWPHFYFFVSASWFFSLWLFMLLVFMLVRCQTCVRLNEVSRCREAHGRLMNVLLCYYQTPDSSQSLRCFLSFTRGLWTPGGPWKSCRGQWTDALPLTGSFWGAFETTVKTVILWNNITN